MLWYILIICNWRIRMKTKYILYGITGFMAGLIIFSASCGKKEKSVPPPPQDPSTRVKQPGKKMQKPVSRPSKERHGDTTSTKKIHAITTIEPKSTGLLFSSTFRGCNNTAKAIYKRLRNGLKKINVNSHKILVPHPLPIIG